MKLVIKPGSVAFVLILGLSMLTACNETSAASLTATSPAVTSLPPTVAPTVAPSPTSALPPVTGTIVKTATGLQYIDVKIGSGTEVLTGHQVTLQYTGYLANGQKFDSSYDHTRPYAFRVGMGSVIKGWDEGLIGMKVGGQRRLIVPPALGYGNRGKGPIPPDATLIFDIELLKSHL